MSVTLYFKVDSVENGEGVPVPCGITVTLSDPAPTPRPYEQIAAEVDKQKILRIIQMDTVLTPDNLTIISEEEYKQLFGED